jgi:hypothetical protein
VAQQDREMNQRQAHAKAIFAERNALAEKTRITEELEKQLANSMQEQKQQAIVLPMQPQTAAERDSAGHTTHFGTSKRGAKTHCVTELMLTEPQHVATLLQQSYYDFLYAAGVGSLGLFPIKEAVPAQAYNGLCALAYNLRVVKEDGKDEDECVAQCDAAGCHKPLSTPQDAYNCPCCIMAMFCDRHCAATANHPGMCYPHPAWRTEEARDHQVTNVD